MGSSATNPNLTLALPYPSPLLQVWEVKRFKRLKLPNLKKKFDLLKWLSKLKRSGKEIKLEFQIKKLDKFGRRPSY